VRSLNYLKDKNIKLMLLGEFPEKILKDELEKQPEWKMVEFKGWVPQKEAYRQMHDADIGLVCFLPEPNHINAIPNKIFEYMAASIPVIASNFPLWKKIIDENQCGICVNPLDPKKIARAIRYLIEHPKEAKRMGENGRTVIMKKYNWESEGKKLLKIYEKMVCQKN
jgi:glycosyltransferase involved in cell wall biosynthesis